MVEQAGPSGAPVAGRRAGRLRTWAEYALLLVVLVTLDFILVRAVLGDAPSGYGDESGLPAELAEEDLRRLREFYGLDKPFVAQYMQHWGRLLRGDLGYSLSFQAPVASVIGVYLVRTLTVLALGMLAALALALTLGPVAAARSRRASGTVLSAVLLFIHAVPPFLTGLVLLQTAAVGWLPSAGAATPGLAGGGWARLSDRLRHALLPAAVLGLWEGSGLALVVRGATLAALGEDYILTARSKGISELRVLWVHALRAALPVLASRLALSLAHGVAGVVFVERVFSYPGMGSLTLHALQYHDYVLLDACLLLFGLVVIVGNAVADLVLRWLTPGGEPA